MPKGLGCRGDSAERRLETGDWRLEGVPKGLGEVILQTGDWIMETGGLVPIEPWESQAASKTLPLPLSLATPAFGFLNVLEIVILAPSRREVSARLPSPFVPSRMMLPSRRE